MPEIACSVSGSYFGNYSECLLQLDHVFVHMEMGIKENSVQQYRDSLLKFYSFGIKNIFPSQVFLEEHRTEVPSKLMHLKPTLKTLTPPWCWYL